MLFLRKVYNCTLTALPRGCTQQLRKQASDHAAPQLQQQSVGWLVKACYTIASMYAALQDLTVCPGVRIEDMGHKMGCNGVDNGKLWFDGMLCASYIRFIMQTSPFLGYACME